VATQLNRSRKPADLQASRSVKCSVLLDVGTNARLAAAAALEGLDKSAWMSRAITEALKGIVVFDRRKSADGADSSAQVGSAKSDVAD
jgi:hypothetical protein